MQRFITLKAFPQDTSNSCSGNTIIIISSFEKKIKGLKLEAIRLIKTAGKQ
jgi:hypothetical protein